MIVILPPSVPKGSAAAATFAELAIVVTAFPEVTAPKILKSYNISTPKEILDIMDLFIQNYFGIFSTTMNCSSLLHGVIKLYKIFQATMKSDAGSNMSIIDQHLF